MATCFFFSSIRRHTSCLSDWSSDVCSSDLPIRRAVDVELDAGTLPGTASFALVATSGMSKIGRASCRERVCFPLTAAKENKYLNAKGALTYTDIDGDPVVYGNLPQREIATQ